MKNKKVSPSHIREELKFLMDNTNIVLSRFSRLQAEAMRAELEKLKKVVDEHSKNNKA